LNNGYRSFDTAQLYNNEKNLADFNNWNEIQN
ncbi:Aldo/keto reductase, partial [Gilliamella apicola SCGC AB-598-B02]